MEKGELVVQDFGGSHNNNLAQTRARLIKGGSWKKQRIVAIVPADYDRVTEKDGKLVHVQGIPAKVALSYWNLGFPPNQQVVRILALGMEVGDAYCKAIEGVLSHPELSQWEYILTMEHDNLPPSDGLIQLLARMEAHKEYACIGGLYFTKGPGGVAQIWGDPKDPVLNFRPQLPDLGGGLVECCGTGMGFNLWRLSMFKDASLRRPWFKTVSGKEGAGTQDLYAWSDFRKHGYRCAVDCSVRVGHLDASTDTIW